jgi:hypothetical protein
VLSALAWLVGVVAAFRLLRAALPTAGQVGLCRYHSALLYTTGVGRRREIHLGTTTDFLAHDDPRRRLLLARLAEGLLALCDDVDRGRLAPDVHLTGTTDLLRDGTAHRLGFHSSPPGPIRLAFTLTAWTQVSLLQTSP